MKEKYVTIPDLGFIAGTRVALGIGIGLLLSGSLTRDQRKAAGWALFGVGALTTIPAVMAVLGQRRDGDKPIVLAA
jgi:hypothetical protein